ncbi:MAG: hypothetical protein R3E72_11695 [Steroidobacteraceae bacterium]
MAQAPVMRGLLCGRTWVHCFEEDSAQGTVYRPITADIPLSRRPRERLELLSDGSAIFHVPAPDDTFVPQQGSWSAEGTAVIVRTAPRAEARACERRVLSVSATRLVLEPAA